MKNLIAVVIALAVFVGTIFYLQKQKNVPIITDENLAKISITPTIPVKTSTPDGWKNYTNEELEISFDIPENFDVTKNGEQSLIAQPADDQDPVGRTRFFYVSVVPEGFEGETGSVYNFNKSDYEKLLDAEVNDRIILSGEDQSQWFTYERFGDDIFNGKTAKVFINQRPWEFPNGTWEYRYIFEMPEKTVIAGAYIEGGPTDAGFSLPLLTNIMTSFVIFSN